MPKLFIGEPELSYAAAAREGFQLLEQAEHAYDFLMRWTTIKPLQRDLRYAFINPVLPSDQAARKAWTEVLARKSPHAVIYVGTAAERAYWDRLVQRHGWVCQQYANPTEKQLELSLVRGEFGVPFSSDAARCYILFAGGSQTRAQLEVQKAQALGWKKVELMHVPKLVFGQAGDVLGRMAKLAFVPGSSGKLARLTISLQKEDAFRGLVLLSKLWGSRFPERAAYVEQLQEAASELRISYEAAIRMAVLAEDIVKRPTLLVEAECST